LSQVSRSIYVLQVTMNRSYSQTSVLSTDVWNAHNYPLNAKKQVTYCTSAEQQ